MAGAARPRLSDELLAGVAGEHRGTVTAGESGLAAGIDLLLDRVWSVSIGILEGLAADGDDVGKGDPLVAVRGSAAELARAEDMILGDLGVACGVATNAAAIRAAAPDNLRIACGGWKKLPSAMKDAVRAGLDAAGVGPRLVEDDFLYVDKNAVRLLGGLEGAARAGAALDVGPVALQVKDPAEALDACQPGVGIIMVDTGDIDDLAAVDQALRKAGRRSGIVLAFAGGVGADDLVDAQIAGAEVVDVGRAILAQPLLDLRFDVALAG